MVTTMPSALEGQAVVYLEDGPLEDQPGRLQTVTISNRQMNFIPFVSVAAVGAKVVFANEDPFPHNVFSPDNDKIQPGQPPPERRAHASVQRPRARIRSSATCTRGCSGTCS